MVKTQISFGLVFYGGLIGVFIGAMVYSKFFKQDCRDMLYYSVPTFSLFQIFGRIGCFLAGCCYGRVSEKYGIAYTHAEHTLNEGPYLPVQLYESAMNLVLFIFLLIYEKANKGREKCYQAVGLYLIPYGTFRFIIEFFRGDAVRGIFGGLSTSQWISLLVVPFGIYCLIVPKEKNILNHWYVPKNNNQTSESANFS